jgi:sulfur transfer protein SufE
MIYDQSDDEYPKKHNHADCNAETWPPLPKTYRVSQQESFHCQSPMWVRATDTPERDVSGPGRSNAPVVDLR